MTTEPLTLSLADIASALRAGTLTASALVEAAIARHDELGETLGAYKLWDPETARAGARFADAAFAAGADLGPLQGIPVSIKDVFGVRGWPLYAGSPRALPEALNREGPLLTALRPAGRGADGQDPYARIRL